MLTKYKDQWQGAQRTITEGVYTLSEFIAAASQPAAHPDNADELNNFRRQRDRAWMGLGEELRNDTSFNATLRLVREGWRTGADMMALINSSVTAPTPRAVRRVQRWQESGDDVDMQRIWAGSLENAWRGTYRDSRMGPQRVRILVDSIASAGDDAEDMKWRGVAALKLCDLLTEAGYSVQVEGVISCKCSFSPRIYKLRTIVKEYEQPLDMLTLAACTVMPAFFRSLMHSWGLAVADYTRRGVSYQVRTPEASEFPDANDNATAFVIPGSADNAEKASEVITNIIEELDKAGA